MNKSVSVKTPSHSFCSVAANRLHDYNVFFIKSSSLACNTYCIDHQTKVLCRMLLFFCCVWMQLHLCQIKFHWLSESFQSWLWLCSKSADLLSSRVQWVLFRLIWSKLRISSILIILCCVCKNNSFEYIHISFLGNNIK